MYAGRGLNSCARDLPSRRTRCGVNFWVHRHSDEILTHAYTLPADRKEPK